MIDVNFFLRLSEYLQVILLIPYSNRISIVLISIVLVFVNLDIQYYFWFYCP